MVIAVNKSLYFHKLSLGGIKNHHHGFTNSFQPYHTYLPLSSLYASPGGVFKSSYKSLYMLRLQLHAHCKLCFLLSVSETIVFFHNKIDFTIFVGFKVAPLANLNISIVHFTDNNVNTNESKKAVVATTFLLSITHILKASKNHMINHTTKATSQNLGSNIL